MLNTVVSVWNKAFLINEWELYRLANSLFTPWLPEQSQTNKFITTEVWGLDSFYEKNPWKGTYILYYRSPSLSIIYYDFSILYSTFYLFITTYMFFNALKNISNP